MASSSSVSPDFTLSSQLFGHSEDVRGICVCGDIGIATGSRDKTVRFWGVKGEQHGFVLEKTLTGHTSFVGPVAWIPPNDDLPSGGLASGGMDTLVHVWSLESSQAVQTLQGHELQVTSIAIDDQGDILSTSIDSTIRRWRKGQCVEVLRGHTAPVQAIVKLPSGEIVTGSSDSTMKLWRGGNCVHTFSGHSDTVRGLAVMSNVGILSASHDGLVKLWGFSGEVLLDMVGHTSIVYCVASHSSGDIASGSEDNYVKIWRDGVCCQSIAHPGCVWDVKFLPNGDLVTACSDGVVRIWTRNQEYFALSEDIAIYEALLTAHKSQTKKVGGVNVKDLPGVDSLQQPGVKPGQTKIVREGDNAVAYSWNDSEYRWDKVGELVDGPDNAQPQASLNGKSYDFVFNVDIGDGEPVRKLPYNNGDNPYLIADQWLMDENLPLSYREQVVSFILQNTGQSSAPIVNGTYRDPYTGEHAYVPRDQQNSKSDVQNPTGVKGFELKHIPKKGMLLFDGAQYDGILKKINAFNASLLSEGNVGLTLNDTDDAKLQSIIAVLKDESHYHTNTFSDANMLLLIKMLESWPISMLFPVLDILKMVLLHPHGAAMCNQYIENGKDFLKQSLTRAAESSDTNLLIGLRVAVNCFRHSVMRNWLRTNRNEILDLFSKCHSSSKPNIRLAYSTLVLNYAVFLTEVKDEEGQIQALSAAFEMAGPQEGDVLTRYRAILTIGSLIMQGMVKNIAVDLDVKSIIDAALTSPEASITEAGKDIQNILRSPSA